MLKSVTIENFMKFKKLQHMDFRDGANFIIGPNGSGKSSCFELIRRCMSIDINHSWSFVADEAKPACVVCKFDLGRKPYNEGQEQTQSCDHILHAGLAYNNKNKTTYKICQISKTEKNEVVESHVDTYKYNPTDMTVHPKEGKHFASNGNEVSMFLENVTARQNNNSSEDLLENLERITQNPQRPSSVCEAILKFFTDKYFVLTFEAHGLSRIQWTRSEHLNREMCKENYQRARDCAEILSALHESHDVNDDLATEYFNKMTHPLRYKFEISRKDIRVFEGDFSFEFLKAPSGILAAKHVSLLLAHRHIRTLCLNEADKGMHPHMIERMRDLVLQSHDLKQKTVLFQSNNQAIISHGNTDRTFVFRRESTTSTVQIRTLGENIKKHHHEGIFPVPFAAYVLFVEGYDDKNFIQLMFEEVFTNAGLLGSLLGITSDEENTLKMFFANLKVVYMGGKEECKSMEQLVRVLGMGNSTTYVFDRDKHSKVILEPSKEYRNDFLKQIETFDDFKDQKEAIRQCTVRVYDKPTSSSQEHFSWSNGTIEEMVRVEILDNLDDFWVDIQYLMEMERTTIREKDRFEVLMSPFKRNKLTDFKELSLLAKFVCEHTEGTRFFTFLREVWMRLEQDRK